MRYLPDHPADSSLSYGLHQSIKFLLAFGAMWLVFTVGLHVLFWVTSEADSALLDNLTTR